MSAAVELERWSAEHDACSKCGTTETPHRAHGMCDRCYQRDRYPGRWPRWLAACIRCGAAKPVAVYRKHGLCWPCAWSERENLAAWRVAFKTLRPGIRSTVQVEQLHELVQVTSVGGAAVALKVTTAQVQAWLRTRRVPRTKHRRLERAWREVLAEYSDGVGP